MSELIVIAITFDNPGDAREARKALDKLDREYFELMDAEVLTKDAAGKVEVHNEVGSSTKTGALVGALLGAPLVLFPVVGLVGPVVAAPVTPPITWAWASSSPTRARCT